MKYLHLNSFLFLNFLFGLSCVKNLQQIALMSFKIKLGSNFDFTLSHTSIGLQRMENVEDNQFEIGFSNKVISFCRLPAFSIRAFLKRTSLCTLCSVNLIVADKEPLSNPRLSHGEEAAQADILNIYLLV